MKTTTEFNTAAETTILNALKRLLAATEPGRWDGDPREEIASWMAAQEVVERVERKVPELVPGGMA